MEIVVAECKISKRYHFGMIDNFARLMSKRCFFFKENKRTSYKMDFY